MNNILKISKKIYNFLIRCSFFSAYYFISTIKRPNLNFEMVNKINYTTVFDKLTVEELKKYLLTLPISSFKPSIVFGVNNIDLKKFSSIEQLITKNNKLYGELSLLNPETYGVFEKLIDKTAIETLRKISNDPVYLNGINIRVSFMSEDKIDHQYLFHRDRDSFEVIKYFDYLTDVNNSNGPLQFLENSYKQKFSEIFKHRYNDNYIKKNYNIKNLINIEGKMGTSFICSTNSFHKQGENSGNFRILITFKFGLQNWKNVKNFHSKYDVSTKKLYYKLGMVK